MKNQIISYIQMLHSLLMIIPSYLLLILARLGASYVIRCTNPCQIPQGQWLSKLAVLHMKALRLSACTNTMRTKPPLLFKRRTWTIMVSYFSVKIDMLVCSVRCLIKPRIGQTQLTLPLKQLNPPHFMTIFQIIEERYQTSRKV